MRTREETLERVREEMAPGRTYAEIARALGCSRSWVSELLSDDDAGAMTAARRKLAHAGHCEECSRDFRAPVRSEPGHRCRRCQRRAETRASVEAELRALAAQLDRTPYVSDAPKLVRRAEHSHGSWSRALRSAGLETRQPGRPRAKRDEPDEVPRRPTHPRTPRPRLGSRT